MFVLMHLCNSYPEWVQSVLHWANSSVAAYSVDPFWVLLKNYNFLMRKLDADTAKYGACLAFDSVFVI